MYFRNLIKIEKVYYYNRYSCSAIISGDLSIYYRNCYSVCINNKDKIIKSDFIYDKDACFDLIDGLKPEIGEVYTLVNINKSETKKSKFRRLINFLKRNNK